MIVFCLGVYHLWGRAFNTHHHACPVASSDDGIVAVLARA
jgi:hypothetical protein